MAAAVLSSLPTATAQTSDVPQTLPTAISAELDTNLLPSPDSELVLPRQFITSGPASWQRGLDAYQRGDYALAESEFLKATNRYSSIVTGTRFGGAEGITEFQRIGGFRQTGSRLRDWRRQGRGISNIERSLARASYAVGASLIKQNRYREAREHFSKALGYDKSLHDARLRLGLIHLAMNDLRGAKRRLKQLKNWCQQGRCEGETLQRSVATLEDAIAIYEARADRAESR